MLSHVSPTRLCSVVDCVVGVDNFELIDSFKVLAMSECMEEMQCKGDISRITLLFSGRCL